MNNKKIIGLVLGAAFILALGIGAVIGGAVTIANAQGQSARGAAFGELAGDRPADFGHRGGDFPNDGMFPVRGEGDQTYLAEALGITVEELQAAQESAWQKALSQAVAQGLVTEEQAQAMQENGAGAGPGHRGGPGGKGMRGWLGRGDDQIDLNALLAEELGITTDELDSARQEASQAAITAAIESGDLTQEQADLMLAHQAIEGYINREELSAQALSMTVEELDTARQEGTTLPDLLEQQGLTQEEYQIALQSAYEAAVNQAVTDGAITQAQADLLLSQDAPFGMGRFPGMGGKPFGHGGPGDFGPCDPAKTDSEDTGTNT